MCGIEYHELPHARMRKEISESYGVLHAVQECCARLGVGGGETDPKNSIRLENVFVIDLCSGKGTTAALCGALDRPGSNSAFLAVDRLLPHAVPHFLNGDKVRYLCRDVMAEGMFDELGDIVREQTGEGRTCILVGMHLCGLLSERAVDFFDRIREVRGLVLSPCCLPRRHEQRMIGFEKVKPGDGEGTAELFNYFRWSEHLQRRLEGCYEGGDATENVRMYKDHEMHTEKNAIIVGVR